MSDMMTKDEVWGRPLLVTHEMTMGWQPDGKRSGQHAGVLWIHVLHAHDICTYSTLIYGVVESWLFCHVVIRWRGHWHSNRLPLESEQRVQKQETSCKAFITRELHKILSYGLLCKVDVNPKDNHQDDCSWNKYCKGNVGSFCAIICINNLKKKKKDITCNYPCERLSTNKYQSILQGTEIWLTI